MDEPLLYLKRVLRSRPYNRRVLVIRLSFLLALLPFPFHPLQPVGGRCLGHGALKIDDDVARIDDILDALESICCSIWRGIFFGYQERGEHIQWSGKGSRFICSPERETMILDPRIIMAIRDKQDV